MITLVKRAFTAARGFYKFLTCFEEIIGVKRFRLTKIMLSHMGLFVNHRRIPTTANHLGILKVVTYDTTHKKMMGGYFLCITLRENVKQNKK